MINKKLQNQQPKEIIRLDYQNGLYQGQHNGYHKDGFGCFCSDDGLFYIGQWSHDNLHGLGALFFPRNGFFYGYFEKNLLHGIGILKYGNNNMVVGNWKESLFHGVIFKYNHSRNFWTIEEYDLGVLKSKVLEKEFEKESPDNEIPYFFSSYIHLPHLYKDILNNTLFSDILKKYHFNNDLDILNKIYNGEHFLGFAINSIPHGLGIIYKDNKCIYLGEFLNGKFEGLGRKCLENDDVADGIWKDGKMHDLGMVFENNTNSYILGSFYENQVETIYHKGEDFPHLLIKKIRNKIHMMNPSFIDNEFSFSKVKFQEEIFVKLFFNFHKNHQLPANLFLKTNRSFVYFDDKNSKIEQSSNLLKNSKIIETTKKAKNKDFILKTIKEINHMSPENYKKLKFAQKKEESPKKIFKKIENFYVTSSNQKKVKEDDKLFKVCAFNDDMKTTKKKNFRMFEDSSYNRLKLLGLEEIMKEIEEVEKEKCHSEEFI